MPFYAVDCMQSSALCRLVDDDVQRYPCIVYYGYGKRDSFEEEDVTEKGIRNWLSSVMPDAIVYLKSTDDHAKFIGGEPSKAKIVYLTEKIGVPPKLKALSIDFKERVSIAAVSKKQAPEVFSKVTAPGKSAPESLPAFFDVQSNTIAVKKGSELRSYMISIINAFQTARKQAKFEELTLDLYEGGVCNSNDHRFCLLVFFHSEQEAQLEREKGDFLALAQEFKKENNDLLRVLYVILDDSSARKTFLTKLQNLLVASELANSSKGGILLWRPKRKRFEKFGGDANSPEEVLNFVRSTIDGGRSLAQRHDEL
eukprot:gnl/TRDRNA2_/TRDRNA2_143497_c0_seq1.p1 gnl/TRDRNA2_/TRDRNA2_143497_c0~~gnl/TRDRNA2_/TRDRNA2_143497_c0_seq1.p1  ORF type:complete len:312 (-),score=62.40 gnl/TRDRNA2_/TRDRNA2_143497_c0_seq1:435-1370(-)